jgi:hypothetical protein
MLHSRLLPMRAATTKAVSLSTEAPTATEALVRTPAAEALVVMLLCLLASRALPLPASLQPRHSTLRHLLVSAVAQAHALVLRLPRLARPAHSTHRHLRVSPQPRRAITHRLLRATRQHHQDTRPHRHHSLQPRLRTVPHRRHILELPRRTTARRRLASAQRRHSTARPARSSTLPTIGVRLPRRRHPRSAPRARHTHRRALLGTLNILQHRLGTLLPLRARRHTLEIRGGRRPARRTHLRKSPSVIVGHFFLLHIEANSLAGLPSRTRVPAAYLKCTYGTWTVSQGSHLALYKSYLRFADG